MDNFRDSYFNVTWDLTQKHLRGIFWGKQYDTGRGFAVTIVEGGKVTVPSTETVRLKWEKPDSTEGYVTAVVVDDKFLIEDIDQMFTVHGAVRSDLEISRGGKVISSITFYVNVEKAVAVDAIESSSEFTALQNAISTVDNIASLDSEIILARGTEPTLGARLDATDAQLAENVKYAGQADYVNLIKDRAKYNRLRVRKNPNDSGILDVIVDNGVKHITYDFMKNTNDDFYLFRTGYVGSLGMALSDKRNYESNTGTWEKSAAPNYYTQQVGATFTGKINGTEIKFASSTDNRGGIWEFVVDGDVENKVTLSTYSTSFVAYVEQIIKTGLEDKEHTIVATFKGDDPANPPSSGAGTSRGWVYYNVNSTNFPNRWTFLGYRKEVKNSYLEGVMLLGFASNKEFAFQITKDTETQFFPEHNGVGTAFDASPKQFLLDGKPLDFATMNKGVFYEGTSFQLIQHVYCKLPNVTGNLATLTITHSVNIDGVLSVSSEIEFLQNCKVNGYGLMFPLVEATLNEYISGIGNHLINPSDNNWSFFSEEGKRVYSYAGIDSRNKDYISAITFDYPYKTFRIGKPNSRDFDNFVGVWQRPLYPKLYAFVFDGDVVTGEKYNWHGRFAIGEIKNIYNYVK